MKRYELCMAIGTVDDIYDGCVVNDLSDDCKRIYHLDDAMLTMAFFVTIFGVNYTDDGRYIVKECYLYDRATKDIISVKGVSDFDIPGR